jgi:hypothetical protein
LVGLAAFFRNGLERQEAGFREVELRYHLAVARRSQHGRAVQRATAGLRRLLEDDVSLELAYHEIMRARPTPEAMVDALVYSLRRGVNELTNADTLHRLSGLDEGQLKAVCRRVQSFNPEIATPWSSDEVAALIAKWRELHERR